MAMLSFVFLAAPVAHAAGLNLGWGAFCPTNVSSQANQSDPCDASTGATYTLIGSFVAPSPAPSLAEAEDFFIDIQENAVNLSDYWKLEAQAQPGYPGTLAGCRGDNPGNGNVGSLAVGIANVNFPTTFTGCVKFWGTSPAGAVNYGVLNPDAYPGIVAPNRARLIGHYAKAAGSAMVAGTQYGVFGATLDTNHQNGVDPTYGPPSYTCAGCADGVCLVFNELIIYQPPGTPLGDTLPFTDQDTRRIVTWQSGGFDCTTVPVKRATWGQIKSLYR